MIKILNQKTKKEATEGLTKTDKIISRFRHKEEEEMTSFFAASIGFPYLDTNLFPVSIEGVKTLLEEESRR